MAQMPRTPVHFPRMKVRGRRNKAKLAARHKRVLLIPHARVEQIGSGIRLVALAMAELGSVAFTVTQVFDGFGRSMHSEARRSE